MASVVAKVDTQHRDVVHDAQLNFYGTRLATCSHDRVVKIFEIKQNGQSYQMADLMGHDGPVWQVTWAHPKYDNVLASCSHDRKVIVWKEMNTKWPKIYEYNQHEASVNSICWAPHEYGLILACASTDNNISILQFMEDNTWNPVKIHDAHKNGVNAVSWAPATPTAPITHAGVSRPPMRIVSGGNDKLVKIWKLMDNREWVQEAALEGHTEWVRDVAWDQTVALGFTTIASCGLDKRVIIWRCKDLESRNWAAVTLPLFEDALTHVSWSLGAVLAVSCADNKVTKVLVVSTIT
uniref:Protein SEC13 homolog n=1 Tax=Steinernema glaseri TaxID=37863 RepID=A0A1I7ZB46_9BILA